MGNLERRRSQRFSVKSGDNYFLKINIDRTIYDVKVVEVSKNGIGFIFDEDLSNFFSEGLLLGGLPLEINGEIEGYLNLKLEKVYPYEKDNKIFAFASGADDVTLSFLWQVIYNYYLGKVTKIRQVEEDGKEIFEPTSLPRIPGRGLYTEQARQERLSFIRNETSSNLERVSATTLDPQKLTSNIEAFIGSIEIPVGIAGPLKINGQNAKGLFYAPMATSEGALVASVTRGAIAISRSGGAVARVIGQRMIRGPMFVFDDLPASLFFAEWIRDHFDEIKEQTKKYSNYAELKELEPLVVGKVVHVQFIYETGDASGQNMTTTCTWNACIWVLKKMQYYDNITIRNFFIEGGLSNDKKVTFQSFIRGRGIRVVSEIFLPDDVLQSVLKVSSEQLASAYLSAINGLIEAGMVGMNINVANVIAAMFTATGQDIACVHEASIAHYHVEKAEGGLYASMMLPSLVIGTVGGGTNLPHQKECLKILGCAGPGNAHKLAEIIVSFCLALDLSTMSAIASGQFASAHERLGRNRPVDTLKLKDLNPEFFTKVIRKTMEDESIVVKFIERIENLYNDNSITTALTSNKTNKMVGLFPCKIQYYSDSDKNKEINVMLKIKPTDDEVIYTMHSIASLCDARLAAEIKKSEEKSGFVKCHIREIAIFQQKDTRFTKYIPKIYGIYRNDKREAYLIVQEYLENMELMDSADNVSGWTKKHIYAAIEGIAEIHSIWYGREEELKQKEWIGFYPTKDKMVEASRLWHLLGAHAHQEFPDWFNEKELELFHQAVNSLPNWWSRIESMPKTLIHNDFNPRNITFRNTPEGLKLCVYDWELATIHLPQHDLAELLCFVLYETVSKEEVYEYIDLHRKSLEKFTGAPIDEKQWWQGFRCSIWDLLINRMPMYMMGHTVKHYEFMVRVHKTVRRMVEIVSEKRYSN
ncbi:MAG: phosphotransferase [Desulfobacterales bacterium]|nr:phosphotransferase [Desulfobacterales bacterium]